MSTSSYRETQLTRALITLGVSVTVMAGLDGDVRLSGQATFRAGSAGVIVDVVARDRRHQPITDLRREEFQVFEDGRLQQMTYFARIDAAHLSGALAAAPEVSPTSIEVAQRPAAKIVLAFEQLSPEGRQIAAAGCSSGYPARTAAWSMP